MNEFIDQFLLESREIVESATRDLLTLEHNPDDSQTLDSVFRSFHTLKGGAAIVDFDDMTRAVHAAEDVLSAARAGRRRMTTTLVGECLYCLDQVIQWLDMMQASGTLPADAAASADAVVARLSADQADPPPKPSEAAPVSNDWLQRLGKLYDFTRLGANCAIHYIPDRDCFYHDEDPVSLLARIEDLVVIEVEPREPWPDLDALDPFDCNLVFKVLTKCTAGEVAAILADVRGQVEISPVGGATLDDSVSEGWTPSARAVLQAQIELLSETGPDGERGRVASAIRSAGNALRHVRRSEQAEGLETETDPLRVAAAIERILEEEPARTSDKGAVIPSRLVSAPRTLRVDAERVNKLVDLTAELLIAKNAIGHTAKLAVESGNGLAPRLKDQHNQLEFLVGELQKSVLGIRVLPLRQVFQRFPRVIREMSVRLGRPVLFTTEGDETEADKTIVEALYEPLLHVLRNAMDHGVEPADQRTAQGKAATASISLRARRQGENVIVEVEDDGRGVDIPKVREIALRRGLVSADALAVYSETEVIELIFAPGFSTASNITDISGRGVGMDAARAAVEAFGGKISIESRKNRGSVVTFMLPFSVMMTRVVTVAVGKQTFGIPLETVAEMARVPREAIFSIGASRAFVFRDKTVPIIDLAETLGYQESRKPPTATLVVLSIFDQLGAIEVDRLGERMEVMLKPMDGILSGSKGVAGATLLGDGKVLLILDVQELLS
jgi:two-component system chemotaxis sensor kinase CheA